MTSDHVKNRNGGVSKNGEAHAMAISMAEPAAYLGILPRSQKSAGWLTGWAAVIGSIRMEIAVIPTETLLISNTKIMDIIRYQQLLTGINGYQSVDISLYPLHIDK